jgi:hypothetical protein
MNGIFFVAAALVAMVLAAIGVFGVQTAAAQLTGGSAASLPTSKARAFQHEPKD